jgi:hypothetical protein
MLIFAGRRHCPLSLSLHYQIANLSDHKAEPSLCEDNDAETDKFVVHAVFETRGYFLKCSSPKYTKP